MELKEKLRQILKERYGIENDAEIIKEATEGRNYSGSKNVKLWA